MLSHPRCLCLRLVQLGESPSLCPATGCYYPMQHCASQLQCHRQCQPSSHDHDPACPGLPQNAYGRKFNESVFYETADAMKANGMQAAGYEYIVIHHLGQKRGPGARVFELRKSPKGAGSVEGAIMYPYLLPVHVWHHPRCPG